MIPDQPGTIFRPKKQHFKTKNNDFEKNYKQKFRLKVSTTNSMTTTRANRNQMKRQNEIDKMKMEM